MSKLRQVSHILLTTCHNPVALLSTFATAPADAAVPADVAASAEFALAKVAAPNAVTSVRNSISAALDTACGGTLAACSPAAVALPAADPLAL